MQDDGGGGEENGIRGGGLGSTRQKKKWRKIIPFLSNLLLWVCMWFFFFFFLCFLCFFSHVSVVNLLPSTVFYHFFILWISSEFLSATFHSKNTKNVGKNCWKNLKEKTLTKSPSQKKHKFVIFQFQDLLTHFRQMNSEIAQRSRRYLSSENCDIHFITSKPL